MPSGGPSSSTPAQDPRRREARSVSFNPNPTINPADSAVAARHPSQAAVFSSSPGVQPMFSALNSRLRRRNSHGAPQQYPPAAAASKIGPQRTTKNAQKLKLLPNPDFGEQGPDEESGRDVYSQYTRITDPTARRDAARLGKADRNRLPRVTAYSTANKYSMEGLMHYLKGRAKNKGAAPKLFDECIYTPYSYARVDDQAQARLIDVRSAPESSLRERRHSDSALDVDNRTEMQRHEDILNMSAAEGEAAASNGAAVEGGDELDQAVPADTVDFDTTVHIPEIFLFEYGVVVIWGMTLHQEQRFLKEIAKFEMEKLAPDDVETECFNFYYTMEYQARIYNDFITLRDKKNYMIKLAISHALAQSVKVRPPHRLSLPDSILTNRRPPSSKNWSTTPSPPAKRSPPKSR